MTVVYVVLFRKSENLFKQAEQAILSNDLQLFHPEDSSTFQHHHATDESYQEEYGENLNY